MSVCDWISSRDTACESSIVKSLITQAWIKCNTFPAVLLCTCSVFDKFEILGLIKGVREEWWVRNGGEFEMTEFEIADSKWLRT